ncbi:MAG: metal-dependent transcriptional regulator [Candidatus Omnitrophica bacterium]|nr:metal-dependent transcriptional regulator [Candidatus Omnitrophota bacterium]
MAIERNEEQDEHIEQLWYMKEQKETSIDFLKKAMKRSFDAKIIEELSLRGLLEWDPKTATIKLTPEGEDRARQLIRAHRLAERLVADVLGGGDLESIACEFEHTVSLELVNGICTLLGHPKECPHGMPIPEGECCLQAIKSASSFIIPLADLKLGESARIAYINCKSDQQIHKLDGLCIRPGVFVKLHQNYPTYVIECEGASIALDADVVKNISVWKNFEEAGETLHHKAADKKEGFGRLKGFLGHFFKS